MIELEAILNEDGTEYSPPRSPLKEKWERLYPTCESMGYGCIFCGKCPCGDYWKIPEEDKDAYDAWVQAVRQYNIEHGNECLPRIILRKVNE